MCDCDLRVVLEFVCVCVCVCLVTGVTFWDWGVCVLRVSVLCGCSALCSRVRMYAWCVCVWLCLCRGPHLMFVVYVVHMLCCSHVELVCFVYGFVSVVCVSRV